jgi:thymidylate synthase
LHIAVHNASHALSEGLAIVQANGATRGSRNGPVIAMDEPMTVSYLNPAQRVVFAPERDANPFFHLYECLWMLQGRRDVGGVAEYVPGMRNYSDDGQTFNAAYGHRWRRHFGRDQISWAIEQLKAEGGAADRRVYLGIWDVRRDWKYTLDKPCNVGLCFRVRSNGKLDMTVFNRSNDLVLGLAGANVVHMSFLHELVALASGYPLGVYHQISNDLHMYTEAPATIGAQPLAGRWTPEADPYVQRLVEPYPIMEVDWDTWQVDLETFQRYGNVVGLRDRFFRRVCGPMMAAHRYYRKHEGVDRYNGAIEILEQCLASDWAVAGREWMERRRDKWLEKAR